MKSVYKIYVIALALMLAEWAFDLGPQGFEESSCAWVGALVSGVMQLAGGIAGTTQANKQAQKVDEQIGAQQRKLDAWRSAQSNFMDRADSREMLRRVAQHNEEQMKTLNTNAIKGGASEEAKVAAASQLGRNYADAVGAIASAGARRLDSVENEYLRQTSNLENLRLKQLMDNEGSKSLASGLAGAGNVLGNVLSELNIGGKA